MRAGLFLLIASSRMNNLQITIFKHLINFEHYETFIPFTTMFSFS